MTRRRPFLRIPFSSALAAAGLLAHLSCGGSPTTPTPPPIPTPQPTLTSIAPTSGTTAGGTAITITGTNFTGAATVTVGGTVATGVSVDSATSLRAVAPAHAAGAADVVVTFGTLSATLPGAYTYVAPPPNVPPTITAVTVQGRRPNQPPNFADLNEVLDVTATVTDPDTPLDQLTYQWSATVGTFTGTGARVTWKAPSSGSTPLAVSLTLTVTDPLAAAAVAGGTAAQGPTFIASVDLHDSTKEIAGYAYDFLVDFSNQTPPPSHVVRNFYSGCAGGDAELADVEKNQEHYRITSWKVEQSFPVTVSFDGTCYRNKEGDACAVVPVEWHSLCIKTFDECTQGETRGDIGFDHVTAVYRQKRWWLCDSAYESISKTPTGLPAFKR